MPKHSVKKNRTHFKKRTLRKKRLNHRGGATVLPSEYFGRNSGRYSVSNEAVNPDAVSHGMPNGSGSLGPNLSPYPEKFNQNGSGFLQNLRNFWRGRDEEKQVLTQVPSQLSAQVPAEVPQAQVPSQLPAQVPAEVPQAQVPSQLPAQVPAEVPQAPVQAPQEGGKRKCKCRCKRSLKKIYKKRKNMKGSSRSLKRNKSYRNKNKSWRKNKRSLRVKYNRRNRRK